MSQLVTIPTWFETQLRSRVSAPARLIGAPQNLPRNRSNRSSNYEAKHKSSRAIGLYGVPQFTPQPAYHPLSVRS